MRVLRRPGTARASGDPHPRSAVLHLDGIGGLDANLAFLAEHENIDVRLFNPFPTRRFKKLGYGYDFSRLNRRMHNKSLTADGQARRASSAGGTSGTSTSGRPPVF